jgi:hypothetical protein
MKNVQRRPESFRNPEWFQDMPVIYLVSFLLGKEISIDKLSFKQNVNIVPDKLLVIRHVIYLSALIHFPVMVILFDRIHFLNRVQQIFNDTFGLSKLFFLPFIPSEFFFNLIINKRASWHLFRFNVYMNFHNHRIVTDR